MNKSKMHKLLTSCLVLDTTLGKPYAERLQVIICEEGDDVGIPDGCVCLSRTPLSAVNTGMISAEAAKLVQSLLLLDVERTGFLRVLEDSQTQIVRSAVIEATAELTKDTKEAVSPGSRATVAFRR